MKKQLNTYFEKAKKSKNTQKPFNEDQLRSILSKGNAGIPNLNNGILPKFKWRNIMTTLSILTVLTLTSWLSFWPAADAVQEDLLTTKKAKSNISVINKTRAGSGKNSMTKNQNLNEEKHFQVKSNSDNENDITKGKTKQDKIYKVNYERRIKANGEVEYEKMYNGKKVTTKLRRVSTIPLIVLNDQELEKLGIVRIGDNYEFINQGVMNPNSKKQKIDLEEKGYDVSLDTLFFRETVNLSMDKMDKDIVQYSGWDNSKPLQVAPIYIELKYKKGTSFGSTRTGGFHPFFFKEGGFAGLYFMRELDYMNRHLNKDDFYNISKDKYCISTRKSLYIDKEKYPHASHLVPVFIRLGDRQSDFGDILLWYMPTPELYAALPDKYKKELNKADFNLENIEIAKYDLDDFKDKFKKDNPELYPSKTSISGIPKIKMKFEELEKFGIRKVNGKIIIPAEEHYSNDNTSEIFTEGNLSTIRQSKLSKYNYPVNDNSVLVKRSIEIEDFTKHDAVIRKFEGWASDEFSKTAPIAVSVESNYWIYSEKYDMFNHHTSHTMYTYNESPLLTDEDLILHKKYPGVRRNASINMTYMIPIKFQIGNPNTDDLGKKRFADITLWFKPTKDFLAKLPVYMSEPLELELQILKEIESGKLDPDNACEALKGKKSVFDLCRISSSVIKNLKVYPNPVENGSANLEFDLLEPGKYQINLYKVDGNLERKLKLANLDAGHQMLNFAVNAQPGTYLLAIISEDGQQVVRKLIVN